MTRALQAAITSLLVLLMTLSSVLDPSHAFTDRHVRGSRHSSCAAGLCVGTCWSRLRVQYSGICI
jgi:hypothetical protein